ncbi:MAG: SRPBCC domain-containing protein, partial [Verrucomicrobia bacterium]
MTTEQNLTEGVVVEQTLDAPVARVWTALTD